LTVFSQEDLCFWEENGYVVVPQAVPQANLDAVLAAMWEFLGMDAAAPDDWYRDPLRKGGMVELYQHQALWDNRQHPKVHQAFSEIWATPKLWVSMDRVNMKPPVRADKPEWDHPGFVHWDVDTAQRPIPFGVQGVLYLEDTSEDQGGFCCVPGFHRTFDEWVKSQPEDRDPRRPDLAELEVKAIPGKAGDLLIWHRLLAHGNGRNLTDKPRLAQYITMAPAKGDEEAGQERVRMWRERLGPAGRAFPGDPRQIEQKLGRTAELTALGRKLLGLDQW
jgi:ectoine hydroxylase-related dioxygenase (phytanoyl-CoA dioxygenase family)